MAVPHAGPAALGRHREAGLIRQRGAGCGEGADEVFQVRLAPRREVNDDRRHRLAVAAVAERTQQVQASPRDLAHQERVKGHVHLDIAPG
jgi:hypothetical protein